MPFPAERALINADEVKAGLNQSYKTQEKRCFTWRPRQPPSELVNANDQTSIAPAARTPDPVREIVRQPLLFGKPSTSLSVRTTNLGSVLALSRKGPQAPCLIINNNNSYTVIVPSENTSAGDQQNPNGRKWKRIAPDMFHKGNHAANNLSGVCTRTSRCMKATLKIVATFW